MTEYESNHQQSTRRPSKDNEVEDDIPFRRALQQQEENPFDDVDIEQAVHVVSIGLKKWHSLELGRTSIGISDDSKHNNDININNNNINASSTSPIPIRKSADDIGSAFEVLEKPALTTLSSSYPRSPNQEGPSEALAVRLRYLSPTRMAAAHAAAAASNRTTTTTDSSHHGDHHRGGHSLDGVSLDDASDDQPDVQVEGSSDSDSMIAPSHSSASPMSLAVLDRALFDSEHIDPSQVDRFGFLIKSPLQSGPLDPPSAKDKKERFLMRKENARSMKWVRMMKRLEKYPLHVWPKKSKKVFTFFVFLVLCHSQVLLVCASIVQGNSQLFANLCLGQDVDRDVANDAARASRWWWWRASSFVVGALPGPVCPSLAS